MKKNGETLNEEKLSAEKKLSEEEKLSAETRILEEKNEGSRNKKLALNLEIMAVQNEVLNVRYWPKADAFNPEIH